MEKFVLKKLLKDIRLEAADKQEAGITYGCCTSHARGEETTLHGPQRQKNRILSLYEGRTKIKVLTASSIPALVGGLIQFCVLRDKSGIYLFRLIALAHFE